MCLARVLERPRVDPMAQSTSRITLRDVAQRAGLSVMTASYAFSRPERVSVEARRRVLEAARTLGYQPNSTARALRTGRSNALGVVVPEHLSYAFRDPAAARYLAGVAAVCSAEEIGLLLLPTSGGQRDAGLVASAPVDGYIFWTTIDDDPNLTAAIETDKPVIVQGGPSAPRTHTVGIDDLAAARQIATTGLRNAVAPIVFSFPATTRGRTTTSHGLDPNSASLSVTRNRLSGFRSAIEDVGLSWDRVPVVVLRENSWSAAYDGAKALGHTLADYDAALCMSDEIAAGVLAALNTLSLSVPGDLAVTGWDDGPDAEALGLTTIRQDLEQQGRDSALHALGIATASSADPAWLEVIRRTTRRGAHVANN